MKIRILAFVFLFGFFLASPVAGEEPTWPKWLHIGCIAGDMTSTEFALHHGAVEGNPFMKNRGVRLGVNVSLSFWIFKKYEPKDHKLHMWAGIARCGVAGWNVWQGIRAQRTIDISN